MLKHSSTTQVKLSSIKPKANQKKHAQGL